MEQCIHSYNNIRFFFRKSISLAEFLTLAEFITFAVVLAISLTQPEFVALTKREFKSVSIGFAKLESEFFTQSVSIG